jgi:opacity protein-like surface antigen
MRSTGALAVLVAVTLALSVTSPVSAFDPEQTFTKGAFVLSLDGGGGSQNNLEDKRVQTGLDLWWIQGRASLLPFGTSGKDGFFYGAFEVGLEPIYQRYFKPVDAYFAGLGVGMRYHFLSLGAFVPYVEIGGAAGGSTLRSIEIDSDFAFRAYGGLGASIFLSDKAALYLGYRMVHVSNGNTSSPNRGFEANTGVFGVSFFLP